jgi:CPA2 family monovalent cation:H+ antiporter-2
MSIDVRELANAPLLIAGTVTGLIALKAAVVIALARAYRIAPATAVETALLLGPGGEFAFVGIGLAATLKVIGPEMAAFVLAVSSVSMALIPLMGLAGQKLRPMIEGSRPPDPALALSPQPQTRHAIVIGYGRVGRVVCDMLAEHRVPFTAVDHTAQTIVAARAAGQTVFYGDATHPAFLRSCGLMDASGVIITIHSADLIDRMIAQIRLIRPDILIVARARDAAHARHLYGVGVTDAVPETIEASLQLSEAALVGLGIAAGPVIASIHQKRDDVRVELQNAAKAAGLEATHAVRAKSNKPS